MSGFVAADAVKPLDYDLNPYVKASGTVPEPSQDALRIYQRAVRAVSPDGTPTKLVDLTDDEAQEARKKLTAALAAFCQGHPTEAQLTKLPHRVFLAFCGWLFGSFTNPT